MTIYDLLTAQKLLPPKPPKADESRCFRCRCRMEADLKSATVAHLDVHYRHTALGSNPPFGWLCETCGPAIACVIRQMEASHAH